MKFFSWNFLQLTKTFSVNYRKNFVYFLFTSICNYRSHFYLVNKGNETFKGVLKSMRILGFTPSPPLQGRSTWFMR
jgi:hypothetical protein